MHNVSSWRWSHLSAIWQYKRTAYPQLLMSERRTSQYSFIVLTFHIPFIPLGDNLQVLAIRKMDGIGRNHRRADKIEILTSHWIDAHHVEDKPRRHGTAIVIAR